jgi:hypothetical protein
MQTLLFYILIGTHTGEDGHSTVPVKQRGFYRYRLITMIASIPRIGEEVVIGTETFKVKNVTHNYRDNRMEIDLKYDYHNIDNILEAGFVKGILPAEEVIEIPKGDPNGWGGPSQVSYIKMQWGVKIASYQDP